MIGIYKVTSPSKKIYIGQSLDLKRRFIEYKRLDCKKQPRLYNSLLKYGVENHKFEIICQCSIDELNEMERFYQDAYCATNKKGLNCILTKTTDRSRVVTEETKKKMGASRKGRVFTEETRKKMSISLKGKKHSEEAKKKMSNAKKNMSDETRAKISEAQKGKKVSEESRAKMRYARRNISEETRVKLSKSSKAKSKIGILSMKYVLHLTTGIFFDSAKEAALMFGYKHGTFCNMLNLNSPQVNTSNCIYV